MGGSSLSPGTGVVRRLRMASLLTTPLTQIQQEEIENVETMITPTFPQPSILPTLIDNVNTIKKKANFFFLKETSPVLCKPKHAQRKSWKLESYLI